MRTILSLSIFLILTFNILASDVIDRSKPYKFTNDFTELLSIHEKTRINNILDSISKNKNIDIILLIVKDFNQTSIADYANEIITKWEIGNNYNDRGILILIKPKYLNEKGEIFIKVTDGLRKSFPGPTLERIIENEIIPKFKVEQYFVGITNGISIVSQLIDGEFETVEYVKKSEKKDYGNINTILIIGIIVIITLLIFLYLGFMGHFKSLTNLLIIGVISIVIGLIGLILRYEIVSGLFGTGKIVFSLLLNQEVIKTTYRFTILISILLIIIGLIFTLKSLLANMKNRAS